MRQQAEIRCRENLLNLDKEVSLTEQDFSPMKIGKSQPKYNTLLAGKKSDLVAEDFNSADDLLNKDDKRKKQKGPKKSWQEYLPGQAYEQYSSKGRKPRPFSHYQANKARTNSIAHKTK